MGICWSRTSDKSNPTPVDPPPPSNAAPASAPAPGSFFDPDAAPSSVGHLDDDTSFGGSNVSGSSWLSMATTNLTTWIYQASDAIAAIWGNVPDDNEFLVSVDDEALPDVESGSDSKLRAFTFEQLKAATLNFRSNMVLGEGGFGKVYQGWLKEKVASQGTRKRPIAVKRLDSKSKQGYRQWRTEVGFLARLSHPNVVKLLGYCREDEEHVIVYEFMKKGSLNYHLFGKGPDRMLSWETRLKVLIGTAQGLAYLHTMEKPIIFRDFKTSNILLDESYTPKLSDFGLAKWGPADSESYVSGHVMGTIGYAAPEYVATGNLYLKSDVYSFGVVLLEMLTGLRAYDKSRPSQQINLVNWVRPFLSDRRKVRNFMDPRLEGKYPVKQVLRIGRFAVRCLQAVPLFRPSMKEVAETLTKIGARYNSTKDEPEALST